ncbi:DNA glycosylase [Xylaria acuta]|nr:DNA glycosylase [Xylaria acuta]
MNFRGRTDQSAAANRQTSDLSDDFMFGFNIEVDDDREYLAEVAKHGIGHGDDIEGFIRLSLLRGMEEWEQAICCASAMKERASFHNPLDGQDILTFLAKVYRVDGPCHATDLQSPLRKPGRPNAKRKSRKICASLDAEIPLEIPVKKKRQVKGSKDSPYWADASVLVREEGGQSRNCPEAKVTAKKAPKKCNGPLEGARPPKPVVPVDNTGGHTVIRVCEGPELASVLLNDQHESLRSASFIDTRELVRQRKGNITGETSGDPSRTLSGSESDTPMSRDSNELQSNSESERTSQQEDTRVNQAPSDNEQKQLTTQKQTPKRKAKSPYFETTKAAAPSPAKPSSSKRSPNKRPPRGTVSALPFPRLDSPRFGLIQEELAEDPFRLLIAVTLLIRTSGKAAIPVFRALVERYPTPADLADADNTADIVAIIRHLGLGAVRAAAIQRHARTWLETPPRNGVRYPVKGYRPDPAEGDVLMHGGDSSSSTQTTTSGWEIGHLTQGPYALDSWRIFCRDVLRGVADDWKGRGREGEFQPEWMRVLPADKELRACLRWMWMREGWLWDPVTGEKTVLPGDLRRAVQDGRVGYDDMGNLRILDE